MVAVEAVIAEVAAAVVALEAAAEGEAVAAVAVVAASEVGAGVDAEHLAGEEGPGK